MKIGVALIVISLLYTLLISIIYFTKKRINIFETRVYSILLLISIMSLIFELLCCYSVSYLMNDYPILNVIICKGFLLIIFYWIAVFTTYVFVVSKNKKIEDNPLGMKTLSIMMVAAVIVSIIIVALPLYYVNSNGVVYSYGPGTVFLYGLITVMMVLCVCRIIFNYKTIKLRKFLPVIVLVFIALIVMVIRAIDPSILIISTMMDFVTNIMYFTIENPDVKMINQLNTLKDQADRANRAKSDFLSSMSHEIRTPLNAIVGFSECIKQEKNIDDCYHDADDIIMASQNLLEIVNGILDISKIEANKMEIVVTNYRPKPIFENLAKLIVPRIGEKPIELNVSISDDLPDVLQGDAGKLKQVTTNILTNAVKYTEHGYINFDVKCINANEDCKLIITVQDTGRGIKPEQMNKLFKKFERLDEDKNTTIEGTGLGLAITKNFVEMMDGTISVQSRYGEGTRFTVCLPQKIVNDEKEKARLMQNTREIPVVDLKNKKVLIVDDNNLNIKVCSKLLAQYDLDITAVDSGFECIELIKNGKTFDIILMDDMMPKMSGAETLANLKKQFPEFNTPTIVLTANNIIEKREKYLSDGFDNCLAKPIEKIELHKILMQYLNKNEENVTKKDISKLENNFDLTNKKILLVDDNKLNIRVTQNVLKIYNPTVDAVISGKECLDLLKTNSYDLILMDDMMPEMSGTETMKILKSDKNFTTPIVVLTANAIEGARENYLSEGFNDYLAKPIDKQELLRVLNNYLVSDIKTPQPIIILEENHYHTRNFLEENGINVESGLKYLKTMDAYNDRIKDFLREMPNKIIRINQYRLAKNTDKYIMEMHTLGNDCKCLGLEKLFEMSNYHELNAKENNFKFIDDNFNSLMLEINRVVTALKKYR